LFELFEPHRVDWYAEGRPATRAEVTASIETGVPLLRRECRPGDHARLDAMLADAQRHLPA
jgi:hypothetical protein